MSSTKRLRMFAGPNGSGKSTIFDDININYDVDLGIYLNADEIEKKLKAENEILLKDFSLTTETKAHFNSFIKNHTLYQKAKEDGFTIDLKFEKDRIVNPNGETHSYEASILTDFIRSQLIERGDKITFETVMSHHSKVEILKRAHTEKYKNYLYFICTENAEINKFRVEERVKNGGHPVAPKKIEERYYRSLKLLREAVKYTHRTFIFDNSGSKSRFILDIYKGQIVTYHSTSVPVWIDEYLFKK